MQVSDRLRKQFGEVKGVVIEVKWLQVEKDMPFFLGCDMRSIGKSV